MYSSSAISQLIKRRRKYYDIDYAKSNIWRNILRSLIV